MVHGKSGVWGALAGVLVGIVACAPGPVPGAPPSGAPGDRADARPATAAAVGGAQPPPAAASAAAIEPVQEAAVPAAPTPVPLEMAIVSVAGWYAPAWLMTDRGLLEQEGIAGEWVVAGIAEAVRSVVSGSVPVGLLGSDPSIVAVTKGAPMRQIAGYFQQPVYDVIGAPRIRAVADLRGQEIAVAQLAGTTFHLARLFFDAHGLRPGDYDTFAAGGNPERLAAVQSGLAAAAVVSDPANVIGLEQGLTYLGNITTVVPEYDWSAWWAYQPWLQQHPDVAVRLLKAQVRGRRWFSDPAHRADVLAVLQERMRVSSAVAEKVYLTYAQDWPNALATDLRFNERATIRTIETAAELGAIERPYPAPSQFQEPQYLERALREVDR